MTGSLQACTFFMAISTKKWGNERYGVGGATCGLWRKHIGFVMLSAGSPLGAARPPNLRQRVFDSLDSLHVIRSVGTLYAGEAVCESAPSLGYNGDLTDFDLWPLKSGDRIANISCFARQQVKSTLAGRPRQGKAAQRSLFIDSRHGCGNAAGEFGCNGNLTALLRLFA